MIIPERLYQRGTVRKHPLAAKDELITALGLRAVVNLYGAPDEDLARLLPTGYLHHPIPDGISSDFRALEYLAGRALEVAGDGAILTLCHAGRNRSGLLSALIVRRLRRVTGAEALQVVRAGRPRAVANPQFARYLEELTAP